MNDTALINQIGAAKKHHRGSLKKLTWIQHQAEDGWTDDLRARAQVALIEVDREDARLWARLGPLLVRLQYLWMRSVWAGEWSDALSLEWSRLQEDANNDPIVGPMTKTITDYVM